jgi:hypothetical protein
MDRKLFLLLVAVLPVMQPSLGAIDGYPLAWADAVFLILAAVVGISIVAGRLRMAWTSWNTAVALFVGATIVSALASSDRGHSLFKAAGTAYLAGLGILSAHYSRRSEMRTPIVLAWLAGTVVTVAACAAGVVLFFAHASNNPFLYGFGSLPAGPYPRVMGLFVNANMLCSYLSAAGVIILASERAGLIRSAVARPAVVALCLTALLTFSPNLGGLALACSLWFAATLPREHRRRAAIIRWGGTAAAVIFVLAILLSPTLLNSAEARVWPGLEPSSRVQTWIEAAKVFREYPWVGAGPGAEVAHVRYINASHGSELLTDAHNTWLSVLAHTGVIGFIPFAVATGMLVVRMRKRLDVTPQGAWRSGVELALLSSLLYPSLSGSFEDSRHVWVLMGMVHAAQTPRVNVGGTTPEVRWKSRRPPGDGRFR